MRIVILAITTLFISSGLFSQSEKKAIQFSGVVVTENEAGDIAPLPYTNVSIFGTSRGTVTEIDGFFSLVAEVGDTVVFSRIGYKDVEKFIPDTLSNQFYSWYQVMSKDSVLLPEAVIYPWPSKEHYKIEFLALNVDNEMRQHAEANLAQKVLDEVTFGVPADGAEAFDYAMQDIYTGYKYSGQFKPMNLLNPVAWAEFIKAWKRGDFKRDKDKSKKKKKEEDKVIKP